MECVCVCVSHLMGLMGLMDDLIQIQIHEKHLVCSANDLHVII